MKHFLNLVSKSVDGFDKSVQDLILIEEMAELTKELLKRRRGRQNDQCVKEELSHVLISLHVVKTVLGITDEDIENEAEKYGWCNV